MRSSLKTLIDLKNRSTGGKYSPNEAACDADAFCSADYELWLNLSQKLYEHIGYWLDRADPYPIIVGATSGRESGERVAAAMCFSQHADGTRGMIFVEVDLLTQRRLGVPAMVRVDQWLPISEADISFQEMLKAVAISDPDSAGTRLMGIHQFHEIANSEAPD